MSISRDLIARRWNGTVRHIVADYFEAYLGHAAISRFAAARGNRGAALLRTDRPLSVLFETLSFWESEQALRAAVGQACPNGFRPEENSLLVGIRGNLELYKVKLLDMPDHAASNP